MRGLVLITVFSRLPLNSFLQQFLNFADVNFVTVFFFLGGHSVVCWFVVFFCSGISMVLIDTLRISRCHNILFLSSPSPGVI